METAAKPRKKRWPVVLFILLLLALLPKTLLFAYHHLTAPPHVRSFTKQQALEDYDAMWNILEEQYSCFDAVERVYKVNAEEVKARYRKMIETSDSFSFEFFYETISKCLFEFKGAAHLVVLPPAMHHSFNMTTQSMSAEERTLYKDSFGAFLETSLHQSTYDYLKTRSLLEWVILNFYQSVGRSTSAQNLTLKTLTEEIAYVKINSFFADHIERDRQLLLDFYKENADKKYLFVDISYNTGGADSYWLHLIIDPNIKQELIYKSRYALYKSVPQLGQNVLNAALISDLSILNTLSAFHPEDAAHLPYLVSTPEFRYPPKREEPLFKGKIIVLTRGSSSATEGFVQFCKYTGFAKVVGYPTKGNSGITSPKLRALANSGLLFYYQSDFTLNSDGSANCIKGETPDIASANGEPPSETALRAIIEGQI